jgi:phage tail-like protein
MANEAYGNSRFYVEIGGMPQAVFTEVSGLQLEMTVTDCEEGGVNGFVRRLPGRMRVGNLTLKRGMTTSDEFFKWCMDAVQGKITRQHVSVRVFDTAGEELACWNFENAFPVKWIGPQFTSSSTTVAIETLELAHDGLGVK